MKNVIIPFNNIFWCKNCDKFVPVYQPNYQVFIWKCYLCNGDIKVKNRERIERK